VLRRLTGDDSPFILRLLNEPAFLERVGDRGVRNLADAKVYILSGPAASYEQLGFGLLLVELKDSRTPIGICGLRKREEFDDVDMCFAFLPEWWSKGYAFESAAAVLAYARDTLHLWSVVAITPWENVASVRLLLKLGFRFERMTPLNGQKDEAKIFARLLDDAHR